MVGLVDSTRDFTRRPNVGVVVERVDLVRTSPELVRRYIFLFPKNEQNGRAGLLDKQQQRKDGDKLHGRYVDARVLVVRWWRRGMRRKGLFSMIARGVRGRRCPTA